VTSSWSLFTQLSSLVVFIILFTRVLFAVFITFHFVFIPLSFLCLCSGGETWARGVEVAVGSVCVVGDR